LGELWLRPRSGRGDWCRRQLRKRAAGDARWISDLIVSGDERLVPDQLPHHLDRLPQPAHGQTCRRALHRHSFLGSVAVQEHREDEEPRIGFLHRDVCAGDPYRLAKPLVACGRLAGTRRHGDDEPDCREDAPQGVRPVRPCGALVNCRGSHAQRGSSVGTGLLSVDQGFAMLHRAHVAHGSCAWHHACVRPHYCELRKAATWLIWRAVRFFEFSCMISLARRFAAKASSCLSR